MGLDRIRRFAILLFVAVPFFALLLMQESVFGSAISEKPDSTMKKETIEQGIVILVDFPDVAHSVTRDFVENRFSNSLNSLCQGDVL